MKCPICGKYAKTARGLKKHLMGRIIYGGHEKLNDEADSTISQIEANGYWLTRDEADNLIAQIRAKRNNPQPAVSTELFTAAYKGYVNDAIVSGHDAAETSKIRPAKEILEKYNVYYPKDTDFAAYARLLQSKWRVKHNYPMNNQPKSNYGNFIETEFAKSTKANYLTENIKNLVTEKIVEIRRNGGLIGEPRIWNNLLSSQPLCFNLFGELYYDLSLATKYFRKLFGDRVTEVTKIDFEFSSKRGDPDRSAFDVFVEYLNNDKKCFIGIEVKYQENLTEESMEKSVETFEHHKKEYIKLTQDSQVFKPNIIEKLKLSPLSQIWRDHLLSFNMAKDYYDGIFVFLYPFANAECQKGINAYKNLLTSQNENETKFYPRDLKYFIKTLRNLNDTDWTRELEERYLGDTILTGQ